MSNRFCNLVPANRISDEYHKITDGFALVEAELDLSTEAFGLVNNEFVNVDQRMDNHVNGSAEKHDDTEITNTTGIGGASVNSAILAVKSQLDIAVIAGSNAFIGVYSVTATGTNTLGLTVASLTYFDKLKLNIKIVNDNTGAVTVNLNSLGAKNLYKVVNGVKTALSAGDLKVGMVYSVEYDSTDFILISGGSSAEEYSTEESQESIISLPSTAQGLMSEFVVEGRTRVNVLTDAVADCSSTSGWTAYVASVATDSANALSRSTCLKITISGANGGIYYDNFDKFTQGEYYLAVATVKNGNATNINFLLNFTGDASLSSGTVVTATTYTRKGIVIQPSDFNNATNAYFVIDVIGANTQYAFVDNIMLVKISATEYALGATTLMSQIPWHLGVKDVDKCRIKSIGKNVYDWYKFAELIHLSDPTMATNKLVDGRNTLALAGGAIIDTPTTYWNFAHNTQYTMVFNARESAEGRGGLFICYYTDGSFDIVTQPTNTTWNLYSWTSDLNKTIEFFGQTYNSGGGIETYYDLDTMAIGIALQSYEPYQDLSATCPVSLRSVSETVRDTWDVLSGEITKNVSDWVELTGNDFTWGFTTDATGLKVIYILYSSLSNIGTYMSNSTQLIKYNNKKLSVATPAGTPSTADAFYGWSNLYEISVSDTDTGWLEAWTTGTSFTSMTWGGLIKSYMNGWKLTTANVDVASCVWTGIASGTTKTGASGYSDTITTLDVGYTPYRMIYRLATSETINTRPSNLLASASGQIVQEALLDDVYTSPYVIGKMIYTHPVSNQAQNEQNTDAIVRITPQLAGWAIVAAGGGKYTSLKAAIDAKETYIYIKNGIYNDGTIVITEDYTTIIGESENAIVRVPSGEDGIKIYANFGTIEGFTVDCMTDAAEACVVVGDGKTAGNSDETIGCGNKIRNMTLLGTTNATFTIYLAGASYSVGSDTLQHYEDNELQSGNEVSGCKFYSTWDGDAISISLQKNCKVVDNYSFGGRIAFYMCRDTMLENNQVVDSTNQGIFVGAPVYNCSINGNLISNPASAGIKIENQLEHAPLLTGQAMLNCLVTNNIIKNPALTGIEISGSSSHEHKNNVFSGNSIDTPGAHGIYLQYAMYNTIERNYIYNCKDDAAQTRGSGIYMVANVQHNLIDSNFIQNDNAAKMAHSAIANREDGTCTYNTVINNFIKCLNSERTIWAQSTGWNISGNFVSGGYYAGVLLDAGATNALVSNNILIDNTRESNDAYSEINAKAGADGATVLGNIITGGTNKAKYGIQFESTAADYEIKDNVIRNTVNAKKVVTSNLANHTDTDVTIASGSITVTREYHTVNTEGSVSLDDLTTIAGGYYGGQKVTLCPLDAGRVVTVKHGSNIALFGGDFVMDSQDDSITLVFDYDYTKWREVSRSSGTSKSITIFKSKTTAAFTAMPVFVAPEKCRIVRVSLIPCGNPAWSGIDGGNTLSVELQDASANAIATKTFTAVPTTPTALTISTTYAKLEADAVVSLIHTYAGTVVSGDTLYQIDYVPR